MTKHLVQAAVYALVGALSQGCDSGADHRGHAHGSLGDDVNAPVLALPRQGAICAANVAGNFPCSRIDLRAGLSFNVHASDIWGWHDERQGVDYALVGLSVGTAFVRLADAAQPEFIAFMRSATEASAWRDIKVLGHYAVVVSEASGHGLQIVDLRRLAELAQYTILPADAHYRRFGDAHKLAVNDELAMAI